MSRRPTRHATRAGFALPLVLVAVSAIVLLLLAAVDTTWRAVRSAREAAMAARTQLGAEGWLAAATTRFASEAIAELPLGVAHGWRHRDDGGLEGDIQWVRTAPDVVWLASRSHGVSLEARAVRVRYLRALTITAPDWPVDAALTAPAPVDLGSARIEGRAPRDSTGCGGATGAPIAAVAVVDPALLSARLRPTWSRILARIPHRLEHLQVADSTWRAAVITDSVVAGPRAWRGMLVRDGPLRLTGAWTVEGVVVVRGPLDATAARLQVRGAVLVADPDGRAPRFGDAAIAWDRCAAHMALTTLGELRSGPFSTWQAVTP